MPQNKPRPTSRPRSGGTARRINDAAASRSPGAVPPSFSPAGRPGRPVPDADAIQIGRPPAPRTPAAQARPARAQRPPSAQRRPSGPRPPSAQRPPSAPRRARSHRRLFAVAAVLVVAALVAWPIGLMIWANGKIQHVDALSGAANTPGTTYLLAGSDSRGGAGGIAEDGTLGARADTIMLLQVPVSGPAALISLPRDSYVKIPGHGSNKLNAAYAWGGAPLLVSTVEQLSGMHVDHFVEVGLGGIRNVVDAVGGVSLCLDPAVNKVHFPVNDPDSGLVWAAAGCKVADGTTALAFTRMRKADLEGDIGRAKRQQQLISSLSSTVATPSLAVQPARQVQLITAGLGALQVSNGTSIVDLGRLALAFRSATGTGGIRGTPPITSLDYHPGGVGSTVRLDPQATPGFFTAIMNGTLKPGPVGGMPAS